MRNAIDAGPIHDCGGDPREEYTASKAIFDFALAASLPEARGAALVVAVVVTSLRLRGVGPR